jgi:hypothetical protein
MKLEIGETLMRSLRFVCLLAVPASLMLGGFNAANAQSQEVQQACTPDAMRLCQEFIPDREKVKVCMIRKRAQLSQACIVAIRDDRKEHAHHVYRRRLRHYYHHHD